MGERTPVGGEYRAYRIAQLKAGEEFADFATWALLFYTGIVTVPYRSKRWQYRVGESTGAVEFKYDKKVASTGNLWIERHEKATPESVDWTPSGILRTDNSLLYAIGNYERIYLLSKSELIRFGRNIKDMTNDTKTSKGYLLPKVKAEEIAIHVVVVEQEDRPDSPKGNPCQSTST